MKVFLTLLRFSGLLLAAGAVFYWQVGRLVGWYPTEGSGQIGVLLSIVLAMLIALVFYEVVRAFEKIEEQKVSHQTAEALRKIQKDLQNKVRFAKSPSSNQEYIELWSGYTDIYWAYNPSFQGIEYRPGMELPELITKVYVPRYRDARLKKALYLFLTKDEAGRKDLEEFGLIMNQVKALCPEALRKLEVKELKEKAACDDGEIYRGTKNAGMISALKSTQQALTRGRGVPYYYLIITDDEINGRLSDHFESEWFKATKVDLLKEHHRLTGDHSEACSSGCGEPKTQNEMRKVRRSARQYNAEDRPEYTHCRTVIIRLGKLILSVSPRILRRGQEIRRCGSRRQKESWSSSLPEHDQGDCCYQP